MVAGVAVAFFSTLLFHPAPQHLIGCNQHDADDERDGKGADQALPHTGLLDLLRGTGCQCKREGCISHKVLLVAVRYYDNQSNVLTVVGTLLPHSKCNMNINGQI